MSQPNTPPPPPGNAPGQSTLLLDLVKSRGSGTLGGVNDPSGPVVTVNGQAQQYAWGRMSLPVVPGRYHVSVHTPFPFPKRFGPAECTVDVAAGEQVPLEYRTPMFTFSRGSLGPPPQKAKGKGAVVWVVLAILLLAVVISAIIVALGG